MLNLFYFLYWSVDGRTKTKHSEVEQQLKKAEAAQRRRIQSKTAGREAEGC